MGPRAGLDGCRKFVPHRDSITGLSSPLASCYTNYRIRIIIVNYKSRLNVMTAGCRNANLTRDFPHTYKGAHAVSSRSAGLIIVSVSRRPYFPLFIHEAIIFISAINKARTYHADRALKSRV